jgi:hypothetical protein
MKYILILGLLLVVGGGFLCFDNPLLVKWFFGEAFYLGKPQKIKVKLNGSLSDHFEVYAKKYKSNASNIHSSRAFFLIRKKEVEYKPGGFRVIIIDTAQRIVFLTSDSKRNIHKSLGCLWQSLTSHNILVDVRDNMKGLNFEPDFRHFEHSYFFNLPKNPTESNMGIDKYEIIF